MSQTPMSDPAPAQDYVFRFDTPIEQRNFGGTLDLSGWLLHRGGRPINGLRAIVKRKWFGRMLVPARRKRHRPDAEAAFPDLPEAKMSGFLFELRLPLGRNHIAFQVLDHERVWRTFQTAIVSSLPLSVVERAGFPNLRHFLISFLKHAYPGKKHVPSPAEGMDRSLARPRTSALVRTKQVELFATTKSNLFIIEIGELIAAGFRELGCTAQLRLDQMPAENPPPDTLQIVVTPHEYYNLFLSENVSRRRARELTRNVVLLCTEQPETVWFHSNLQWVAYARGVADINALGVLAYRRRGLRSQHFHLGYHEMLAAPRQRPHPEREYDITFLGSMTARREEFLARHAEFFSRHRCHLRLVPLSFAKTKITRSYLTAQDRNELLGLSRILLNLHYSEEKYFEWHRMLAGLANGCCVISETCEGYGALVPGEHFIMVEREDLVPCCEYYLRHPDECARIARQGLEFVRTHLRQAQSCQVFLQEFEAGAAVIGEIVPDAPPVTLPRELIRTFSGRRARALRRALAADFKRLSGKSAPSPREVQPELDLEVLSKHRLAAIKKREAFQTRLGEQEDRRAAGETVWNLHDNEFYTQSATPRLSVVITLFNYAHYLSDCLGSITRAAAQLPDAPEIVIVNDASTDDSLAHARHFQNKSTLPVRIVDKRFNTGLANARNVGITFARAPFIFMMDADNLVFPNALRELLDAISKDNHAAAYSLLCRFRGTPANRVGLLSYYDWDPQIMVQYPYIDAMAMFRRDALLELGGYDNQLNQIGWFGWEDYDMWLRFVQKNYRVGFVPNILCLYRHHQTSMLNVTNLFELDLVRHFIQRFQDLVGSFEPRATLFGVDREKIVPAGDAAAGSSPLGQSSVPTEEIAGGSNHLAWSQRGGNASSNIEDASDKLGP
jgi:GT2 family glycosyltransferase